MISSELENIFNKSIKFANSLNHEYVTLENVLLSLIEDPTIATILKRCSASKEELKGALEKFLDNSENFSILSDSEIKELAAAQFASEELREVAKQNGIRYQPEISMALQRVIQRAALHVQSSGKKGIKPVNLLVALFSEKNSHAVYFLKEVGVDRLKVVSQVSHGLDKATNTTNEEKDENFDPLKQKEEKYKKALDEFAVNLSHLAKQGKIDPVIGREREVERMIQILCRRRKNNPILVGESGVGKTAIAEGLALRIASGDVPGPMKEVVIYSLDMASLLAGTKFRGDFEERLKTVIQALKSDEKEEKVLFIDEIHTIIGAGSTSGGSLDASNLLKPSLSRGELRCIGSTTYDEYRKFFEKDQALSRRFQKIDVLEPSAEDSLKILEGLKEKFEKHHGVEYPHDVLKAAVDLSIKHLNDKKLPDKAIDVIDEVGSALRLRREDNSERVVTINDIEKTISLIARIPEKSVSLHEKDKLQNLERDLKLLIYGQNEAVEKVSQAVIMSRSGLREGIKPIASFLFAGPTGVGKTELAKQLAHTLGLHFERIDMSEYMEKHSVSKLIGSPPGYVGFDQGGILTESINKNPYCILLLDEIEKAHTDIYNILLQVMDHGKLSDSNGRSVDFSNVILIMTSNAGAMEYEAGSIGFSKAAQGLNSSKRDLALKKYFAPEFRNRLDAIIHFNKLEDVVVESIVQKFMMKLENLLLDKKIELEVGEGVHHWLAQMGYDEKLGARPLERIVNEKIKKVLSSEILFGKLEKGGRVKININDDELEFDYL